jgi:hypothetical protein
MDWISRVIFALVFTTSMVGGAPQSSLDSVQMNPMLDTSYDMDHDGLATSEEDWVAKTFAPVYIYDEEEHNHFANTSGIQEGRDVIYLFQVTQGNCLPYPVFITKKDNGKDVNYFQFTGAQAYPTPDNYVIMTIVAAYRYDYVPYDPVVGGEKDLTGHLGDTETMRICFARSSKIPGSSDLTKSHSAVYQDGSLKMAYTPAMMIIKRHFDDPRLYLTNDFTWEKTTHPDLYISEGKHAAYKTENECEHYVSGIQWLGWDEDCGGGTKIWPKGLSDYTDYNFNNVGESDYPSWKVEFQPYGSSSRREYTWGDKEAFCGGYNIYSPNANHTIVEIAWKDVYKQEWCGGSLGSKWVGSPVSYTVTIKTYDSSGAGTGSNIYLYMMGSIRKAGYIYLDDPDRNDFERGHEDTFKISLPYLGYIQKICLFSDNAGDNSPWKVDWVMINYPGESKRIFKFDGQWLSTSDSPKRLWACRAIDSWPDDIWWLPKKQ